jgi:hypothetical protein
MFVQPENVRRLRTRRAVIILCIRQLAERHSEGESSHSEQDRWSLFLGHAAATSVVFRSKGQGDSESFISCQMGSYLFQISYLD